MTDTPTPAQGDFLDPATTGGGDLPLSGQAPPNISPMSAPALTGASPWRAILAGALYGLANSSQPGHGRGSFATGLGLGAEGAVAGAQRQFENQQKQAVQASAIKFQRAQAANLLVEARLHQAQLDNLPQEQQDEHNKANVDTLEHLKNAFPGLQVVATNNDHDSINAAMQSATSTQGGVPAAIHLNVGHQMFSIPLDQDAIKNSGGAALEQINDMLKKQGAPLVTSAVYANMRPEQRGQLLDQSVHFSNPLPSEDNLKTYKNYLATAQANKDSASAAFLQPIVDKLQTAMDAENKRQADIAAAKKKSEVKADIAARTNPEAISGERALAKGKKLGEQDALMGEGSEGSSLIDEIGTGKMPLERMSYVAARNPQLLASVAAKYPDFDASKAQSYIQTYHEFTSDKPGTPGSQLNAGATALKHLAELRQLNTVESRVPGTADHNAFQNKLDTITGELATFYGMPKTDQTIQGMKSTLGALTNRDAAIREQAKSMGDKFDSMEQTWRNAAPSKAYEAPMPGIDDAAKAARASLDPSYATRTGGTPARPKGVPAEAVWNPGAKQWQLPQ